MKYDPELAALLAQPWSNNACRGYVIYAMENCGFCSRVTSGVWWQSSMRSLTSVGWRRPSSTLRTAPTDLGTSCPKVEQGKRAAPLDGAAFLRFPTGQGGLSVIVSYRSGRRPTWKIPYPSRRNTPIKSAKSNSLSRPSTRTKASPCVTSC